MKHKLKVVEDDSFSGDSIPIAEAAVAGKMDGFASHVLMSPSEQPPRKYLGCLGNQGNKLLYVVSHHLERE